MFDPQSYIIFEAPENQSELGLREDPSKKAKFAIGSFNTKLLSRILLFNGIKPTAEDDYTLLWATSPEVDTVSPVSPFQRINHFPYSKQIVGNKAELAYIIQNHPNIKEFEQFFPSSYILPDDRDALFMKMKANPKKTFIAKPPEGSCGHGIKIVSFADFYTIHHNAVVSEYVARPLTIDSFKFDFRIYVLVTSFAPLSAFVYREGLARFATESYNVGRENVYSQLTNATLNKHGRNWSNDFKWKLSDMLLEIEHRFHKSTDEIMGKILDTVAKTLALIQPTMAPNQRTSIINPFFELYGFDLLLDRDFNMWLIEINTNPAMGYDESVDYEVKGKLLSRALSIVGIPNYTAEELTNISIQTKKSIEEIEADIIRGEDERNEQTGNGFIRIFPSESSEYLSDLLKKVLLASSNSEKKQKKKKSFNPKKLAQLLTTEQASEILIHYLIGLEKKSRDDDENNETKNRIWKFFSSLGYQFQKKVTLRSILRQFINDARANYANDKNAETPEPILRMILDSNDDYLEKFFKNCNYNYAKTVKFLFE